ncbi:unnamed protein product [Cyprideis torosa]|uniref:Uncharacterized protein n=1 Tax=Cyprideis torosa TaxID=163714 RepID=A0A7R8WB75_9CRUS|nr:unnamed protein product [Cyprideis torosa]CAG0890518.1 unnamed protein product [Cyprideis torosa]
MYAIGDTLHDRLELQPVAAKAGKYLARRMFSNSTLKMDYSQVPTTVFTPLEYASVGLSEDSAMQKYGEDNIEVYHAFYKPLEFYLPQRDSSRCYIKMICDREVPQRAFGLHITGPNAGEIMQGFAVAFKLGLSKASLEKACGIHPTVAEEITKLNITKRSGRDPVLTGC